MAFISLYTSMQGLTIEDFRTVSAKHNPPQDIDGLLVWTAGTDENGLHVVTIWESRAHAERFQAEQLFPAFQATGMMTAVVDNSTQVTFDTDEIYVRSQ